jgi:hypothetical protein
MERRGNRTPRARWCALAALALLPGCGGDDSPASPSLNPPEPTWEMTPAVASVTYAFSWPAQPGATSYRVEIGTSVGASDMLSTEVTAPALTTTLPANPAVPDYYLRFFSRGPAGESAPKATFAPVVDLRTIIEALFFETGPRRPAFALPSTDVVDRDAARFRAFGAADVMLGWPPGARVTVIASTALRDEQLQAARDTVDQFNQAVGGVIRATLTTTSDPDPRPRPGTITLAPGDPVAAGCGGNAIGCAVRTVEDGVILDARLVVTPSSRGCVTAHEIGHGLQGFGHINLQGVPGLSAATMSPGGCDLPRLTGYENDAIRESYARGMRAGDRRQDFVRAGLIVP